jgi:hypothetical protein
MERVPPEPVVAAVLALVFLLCLRSKALVHRYVASLGLLAVLLLARYAWSAGLLGSAWRGSVIAASAAKVGWTGDPVLIVLFDELENDVLLKDGRIDAELFPHFAALAADSAWFTRAQGNFLFTKDALPSMLTGRFAPREGGPRLFDFLPEDCGVVVREHFQPTHGWLRRNARPNQISLLNGRVERPLENLLEVPRVLSELFLETPFSRSPFGVTPARRIMPPLMRGADNGGVKHAARDVDDFLASLRPEELRGRLVFWHAPIPHFPFQLDVDGRPHGDPCDELLGPASLLGRGFPEGYSHARALENYRKQSRFCDTVLGRIVERLRQDGLYDRTTLVVTSDHGLRTWGALAPLNWPVELPGRITRVPLMIRGPRVKPGAYDVDYQHVDFTPTVLDALGIPFRAGAFEGVSGFAASRPERPRTLMDSTYKTYAYDAARDVWSRR